MSKIKYERSEGFCSRRCRSVEHADEISSAILRGNEDQAIAFMCWRCYNYSRLTDEAGRTALHIAASCGKTKVLEWILRNVDHESCINAKDYESGYTPLHRSLFHGQLSAARCLIRHGAKLTALDNDGLLPLDHLMKDGPPMKKSSPSAPCEVFVWGRNMNFNLGIGSNESRRFPDTADYFRRNNISIKQVALGKFHTIFVSSDGRAFSCGHGRGRLGSATDETAMAPMHIYLNSNLKTTKESDLKYAVESASVGQDHSLLLTKNGTVYTFGLNTHSQLGLDSCPSVQLLPKPLRDIPVKLVGVKAAHYHSVAWCSFEVYTWGANYGQLGHGKGDKFVVTPRAIPLLKDVHFQTISAGDNATIIGSKHGDIFLLQYYICRKIGNALGIPRQIEVVGGCLDPAVIKAEDISGWGDYRSGEDELCVAVMTKKKKLMLWCSSIGHFWRCDLHVGSRKVVASDFAMGTDKLLVITDEGEGFETEFKIKKRRGDKVSSSPQTALQKLIEKDKSLDFQMEKIMFVHRAVSVYSCPKSLNFSIVQLHPNFLTNRPKSKRNVGLEAGLLSLLEEADESDCLADVIFYVHGHRIPAHRYILESNSKYLASLISSAEKMQANSSLQSSNIKINDNYNFKKNMCVTIKIEGVNPVIFKEVLKFIYAGNCDISVPGQWSCEKDYEYSCFLSMELGSSHDGGSRELGKMAKSRPRHLSACEDLEHNPVSDAQRAAARFELDNLVKLMDGLQYNKSKCSITRKPCVSVEEKSLPKISLSPSACSHLFDVVIECMKGKIINAHKCILAMRSQYFETMFKGDWIECTGLKNVTLPFSYEVVQAIISYLYQDNVPSLNKSCDLSHICNVLVASDQILLDGLKETCEILLTDHITLKNVSEFYQISNTYNSSKLKKYCLEFMCMNLSALLEFRALDDVDSKLFDDLQVQYWRTRPAVLKRYISVPSKYPDLNTLQSVFNLIGVPPEEEHFKHLGSATQKEGIEASRRHRVKRKQKLRHGSVDEKAGPVSRLSVGSNSGLENDQSSERCDPVENENISELFDDCVRISDQVEANESLHLSKDSLLVKSDSNPVTNKDLHDVEATPKTKANSVSEEDFPLLSRDGHQASSSAPSKTHKTRRMTKLSQKERKKQLTSTVPEKSTENRSSIRRAEVNPWGRLGGSGQDGSPAQLESPSLSEIINEEKQRRTLTRKQSLDDSTGEENKSQKAGIWGLSIDNPPSSPPTDCARSPGWPPWMDSHGRTPPSSENQVAEPKPFNEIVADEKRQRELTKKMMEKPLNLTLIEDRAMRELQTANDREHEHDQRVTVRRVTCAQVSKPVWINSKNH